MEKTAAMQVKKKEKRFRQFPYYIMILPGVLYLFINNYIPMAGIFIAFKDIDFSLGIFKSKWVGFKNFEFLFKTSDAWIITRNTLLYNKSIGADGINWYSEKKHWPFILVFVNTWKGAGYGCIVYLAAILGIDQSLYESARVDGAGKIRQIFSITLPLLKPTIITMVMMSIGRIFYSDFGLFYQVTMNSGALYDYTSTIDTYVYRALLQRNDLAMSSAAAVYQSVVGFVIIVAVNALVRKIDADNALF